MYKHFKKSLFLVGVISFSSLMDPVFAMEDNIPHIVTYKVFGISKENYYKNHTYNENDNNLFVGDTEHNNRVRNMNNQKNAPQVITQKFYGGGTKEEFNKLNNRNNN